MKLKSIQLLAVMALLCWASWAQAVLSCTSATSTGFSTAINAVAGINASVVPNITQGTVTFNCTRTVGGDALSVLLSANNGSNAIGAQNRARPQVGARGPVRHSSVAVRRDAPARRVVLAVLPAEAPLPEGAGVGEPARPGPRRRVAAGRRGRLHLLAGDGARSAQ